MGGAVGVDSTIGEGSLFWFELPVSPVAATAEPDVTADSLTERGSFRGRILVAEDNPVNREVLIGLLEHLGLDVESAHDGQAATEAVAMHDYDLVLMDMQMPRKSGIEATQDIRRSGNSVRIAGVTANAFTSNRRDCERAGMNDFLAKPVTLERLARLLQRQGVARAIPAAPADIAIAAGQAVGPDRLTADHCLSGVPDQLRALTTIMGAEPVARLLAQFASDLDTTATALAAAVLVGDHDALDRHLHAFKGAAGTLGFAVLSARSQELRDDPSPDAAACAALIAAARETVARVRL
jgi:CheY-like chemotaxis protein/HPt (histidine-containing phosphotransfer) domain-containing protein